MIDRPDGISVISPKMSDHDFVVGLFWGTLHTHFCISVSTHSRRSSRLNHRPVPRIFVRKPEGIKNSYDVN